MLGCLLRRMVGIVSATHRLVSTAALIGLVGLLTGCWGDASVSNLSNVSKDSTTPQLASISISPPDSSLAAGYTQRLTATGIYSDGSKKDLSASVVWKSSGLAIATMNTAGAATALATGVTTVIATDGKVSGSTTLTVTAAHLVSIGVTPAAPSIALGTTQFLQATGVYSDNTVHDITNAVAWTSATPTVAGIDGTGLATASGVGSTLMTAKLDGITSAGVTLKVTAATLVSIAVTPSVITIANGTQQQFTATGLYSDRSIQDLSRSATWSSSTSTVATISNLSGYVGLAQAHGVGTTSITATVNGVTSPPVTLTVNAATLASIAVTPAAPSLVLGLNQQLNATGTYTDNSTQDLTSSVTWTSGAPTVADVSSALTTSGLVTSHSVGSATITATLGTVSSTPVALTVTAATLVSIGVTPAAPSIALGTGLQFAATGTYTDNSTQNLTTSATWVSSDGSVASISNASGSKGLATSLSVGSTTVTAAVGAVTSNAVMLTVTSATLVSIAVTPATPSIALGTGLQFTATGSYTDNSTQDLTTSATWISSDSSVASVSNVSGSNGLATSLSAGNTMISAALGSVVSSSVPLTVTAATLVSIAITPAAPSIALGTQQQLVATGSYTDNSTQNLTGQVTWISDNTSVSTVSNASGTQGMASSAATGSAHITATLGSVTSASITLTVTPATLVSIAVTPPNPTVALGINEQFAATGTYTDNSTQDLTAQATWTSSNPQYASISNASGSQGLATSLSVGSTVIGASLGAVNSATVTLHVTAATLVSIAVTPASASIALGTNQQYTAVGTYTDASTQNVTTQVTWTSGTSSVATISNASGSQGYASSLSVGSTTIGAGLGSVNSPTVTLNVTAAALVSIAVTPATPSIALGTHQQFTATGTYTDNSTQNLTTQVTWISGSSSVASISNASGTQGLATALSAGSTAIGASLGMVSAPTVTLNVMPATLVSIAVTPGSLSVALGNTQQFTATGTYTDNSTQDLTTQVTWTSSNSSVASISNASGTQGLATPIALGSTSISASVGMVSSAGVTLTATLNFTTPGAASWTVPAGITSIRVVAIGGGGGSASQNTFVNGGVGGGGAIVTSTLSVNPGDILTLYVGGGGGGGIGGGGGSTNVNAITAQRIIAGGGGGGGFYGYGNGGNAGGVNGIGAAGTYNGGGGGSNGNGGAGANGGSTAGGSGNGGGGGFADYGSGGAGGLGSGTGHGGQGGYGGGGGGGGGYGGGGGGFQGGGGAGGSTGPSGSTYATQTNGGSANSGGGNGSIVISLP